MTDPVSYTDVNDGWGGIVLPPITVAESKKVHDRLVRKFGGRKMRMPWWHDRVNRSWASTTPQDTKWHVPGGRPGLPRMIHDVSHQLFSRLHPTLKTHSHRHAELEQAMIRHVIAKGWHLPKPKPEPKPKPTKDEVRAIELQRTEASIRRWQQKHRLATTWLRKLTTKQKRLKRNMEKAACPTAATSAP